MGMNAATLRKARKELGWSQQKAAARLGVSQSYLSMLETGERMIPERLARKMAEALHMPPTSLPARRGRWSPGKTEPDVLARQLAALGYPGFSYLRGRRAKTNPAEVLLAALAEDALEARMFEALPWLVVRYWEMDRMWLTDQARLNNLQNRLGFVVTLARRAMQKSGASLPARSATLEKLESMLRESLLAREDTFGQARVSEAERDWMRENRPEEARAWNLLTMWRAEDLRYAA